MTNTNIVTLKYGAGSKKFNLMNHKDLIKLITHFTDGVYNTEDSASFNENEIEIINAVRKIYSEIN